MKSEVVKVLKMLLYKSCKHKYHFDLPVVVNLVCCFKI